MKLTEEQLLKKHFEEKYLKGTCFNSLEELLKDKTLVQINAPRALIAVELKGVWRALKYDSYHQQKTAKTIYDREQRMECLKCGKSLSTKILAKKIHLHFCEDCRAILIKGIMKKSKELRKK